MQTAQAFGQLQDNLSFFRNAYDQFATYRATLNRLSGFSRGIDDAAQLHEPDIRNQGDCLALQALTVATPDGRPLVRQLNLEVRPDAPLLIRGPSGAGKTTLLRAIAGLWPYCEGTILRPLGDTLFLSQKPYLPQGSLRGALYYPRPLPNLPHHAAQEAAVRDVLAQIQLGHLAERLDDEDDWSRILSLGEQQRLAFGRLLLLKPRAALLDEATSAMDEGLEDAMYRLVHSQLPGTILLSVGHRSTLLRHHANQLLVAGDGTGGWQMLPASAPYPPAASGTWEPLPDT